MLQNNYNIVNAYYQKTILYLLKQNMPEKLIVFLIRLVVAVTRNVYHSSWHLWSVGILLVALCGRLGRCRLVGGSTSADVKATRVVSTFTSCSLLPTSGSSPLASAWCMPACHDGLLSGALSSNKPFLLQVALLMVFYLSNRKVTNTPRKAKPKKKPYGSNILSCWYLTLVFFFVIASIEPRFSSLLSKHSTV